MSDKASYRPDIDGLRAFAVLMVVVFHTFPQALPGGFLGVDVFLVISGYLISGHIAEGLRQGRFSFLEFYAKRCRRILPALFIVLISVWVLGKNFLLPNEFSLLGKHLLAGATFFSNITLYGEVGYFDVSANLKPLLHLWSLAIEEQFYIIWPLFLFGWIDKKRSLAPFIFALLLLSLFANLFEVIRDQSAAFYLLPFRFWELLIGAFLAQLEVTRSFSRFSNLKSLGAIVLLFFGGFFPRFGTLIPTIAAFLFISAGPKAWLNKNIFSKQPLVNIGLVSYPLYLWHWPLLSLLQITSDGLPSQNSKILAVLISFLLSELTYYFIEKPVQKYFRLRVKQIIIVSLFALVIIGALGFLTWQGKLQSRLEVLNSALNKYGLSGLAEEVYWKDGCFAVNNDVAEKFKRNKCDNHLFPGRPTLFLLGDSHSAYLSQGLRPFLVQEKINFEQFSAGWCTPLDTLAKQVNCADINKFIWDRIKSIKPEIVLFFSNYQQYPKPYETDIKDFESFISARTEEMKALGVKDIIVLGQIPTWSFGLPTTLSRRYLLSHQPIPIRTYEGINPDSLKEDAKLRTIQFSSNTEFISLRDELCTPEGCLTHVGPNLETDLTVFDYGHLTPQGAKFVTEKVLAPRLKSRF